MESIRDWFFEGYKSVFRPDGKGGVKRKLLYTGVWYGFTPPSRMRRRKIETAVLTVFVLLTDLYAQFVPGVSGLIAWVGAAANITLFPMIFVLVGQVCFLMCREKWEVRNYYSGYRRLFQWGIALLVLCGLWLGLVILVLALNPVMFRTDWPYLTAVALCTAAQALQVALIVRNPAYAVQGALVE